jgi:hypothetical protein
MNMRGIQVAVPDQTKQRLDALTVARDLALAQQQALQSRLSMLDDHAVDLRQRLVDERDKQSARFNVLSRLMSSCNQWLFTLRLRPGEVLQSVSVPAKLEKGQTAAEAIGKLRVEMLAISQGLAKVRTAPLPVAEQIAAAERYVQQRGAYAGQKIGVVRDQLSLSWQDDVLADKQTLFGLLAWLAPTSVLAALKREIEAQPAPVAPMPAADRIRKVSELEAKLLDLERRESALLDDTTLPRPEMSPMSYLQVQIIAREAAAA